MNSGADLGGGCRGCVPPPPWDDLRFSNTTGILQKKKNYVVYWCWSRARDECTPSKKKSWIRPWNYCIDLILGKAFCIFIFFRFPDCRLSVLKGFRFCFCFLTWVKTENRNRERWTGLYPSCLAAKIRSGQIKECPPGRSRDECYIPILREVLWTSPACMGRCYIVTTYQGRGRKMLSKCAIIGSGFN